MRVFDTGASSHLGSAVVPGLISTGHEVVGLARCDTSAVPLEKLGAFRKVLTSTLACHAPRGIAVTLGDSGGERATVPLAALRHRGAPLIGFTATDLTQRPELAADAVQSVLAGRVSSATNPLEARICRLRDADHAIRHLQQDRPSAKAVLVP